MYAIGRLELVPINTIHVHQTGNAALNMIMDVNLQQITAVVVRSCRQVSYCQLTKGFFVTEQHL